MYNWNSLTSKMWKSPKEVSSSPVISNAVVSTVEREVDAVHPFQVQVLPRKVWKDRHWRQVHELQRIIGSLWRHREDFRRRIELDRGHRGCQIENYFFRLGSCRVYQISATKNNENFLSVLKFNKFGQIAFMLTGNVSTIPWIPLHKLIPESNAYWWKFH